MLEPGSIKEKTSYYNKPTKFTDSKRLLIKQVKWTNYKREGSTSSRIEHRITPNYYYLLKRESKVLKRIILNVTLFCVAWLPYACVALLGQFGNNIENYLTPYTTSIPAILAKFSSIYNPILYTLTNRDCKAYFKRIFKLKC